MSAWNLSIFLAVKFVGNDIFQDEAENINAIQFIKVPGEYLNNCKAQVIVKLFSLLHLDKAWLPFEPSTSVESYLVVQILFDHMLPWALAITDVPVICYGLTLSPFLKAWGIVPCHLFTLFSSLILGQCWIKICSLIYGGCIPLHWHTSQFPNSVTIFKRGDGIDDFSSSVIRMGLGPFD